MLSHYHEHAEEARTAGLSINSNTVYTGSSNIVIFLYEPRDSQTAIVRMVTSKYYHLKFAIMLM